MNILMIEDNESVSEMMQMFFLNEGWEAEFKYDGKEGLDTFKADPEKWDMITLDLNLPGMDGMEVGREIRKVSKTVPIIMLTARDSESDQVIGLEMGADDYVTKPFSPLTLIARIKALHRRSELTSEPQKESATSSDSFDIQTDHFKMNLKTREAYLDDQPIEVDAHIKKLRQKIEKVGAQVIQTVWGVGYKFDDTEVGR
jgi:DNA-binding response OmpR family regulator